jgi:non-ribosomal peptide synthetase component F
LKSGTVYLPLNSAYRESEIAYFLGDAEPKIFVHAERDTEWVTPICERLKVAPVTPWRIANTSKDEALGT